VEEQEFARSCEVVCNPVVVGAWVVVDGRGIVEKSTGEDQEV